MKKFLLATCLFLCASGAWALDPWGVYDDKAPAVCNDVELKGTLGLAELTEKAICANTSLKISYLSVLSSGASYGQGLADYLPSISASAGLTASNSKIDGGNSDDSSDLSAFANLNWLLLDFGGRNASVDRLKAYLQSSYFSYDDTLQTLIYDVSASYYAVLSAMEKYEGLMKSEESSKKSFEEASSRYKLGLVPLSDKLQAQTSYEQSLPPMLRAKISLSSAVIWRCCSTFRRTRFWI